MKIIIFGSNGMLGSYLKSFLSNYYMLLPLTRNEIDISTISDIDLINTIKNNIKKNDIIINASGIINPLYHSVIDMIKVNSVFPNILAKIKDEIGCNIIHITTDGVFNRNSGGKKEDDVHDCIDDYSKSKSLGENPLLTIIRTSIIGEEKNNKKSFLEWVKSNKGKIIDGYENHLWNGITCLELCKFIHTVIKTKNFWTGVRHIYSPNYMSKHELATLINNVYDLKIIINKVHTQQSCNRVLETLYENPITKTLYSQILELKNYKL
jgi:dTDP-4-dehydrorhamnose reductase